MSNKFIAFFFMIFFVTTSVYGALPINNPKSTVNKNIKKKLPEDEQNKVMNPNRNANLAFAFGLGTLLFPPLAVPALILGIISLSKKEPKEGYAITGIVMGGLTILAYLALIVLFFILLL